MLSLARDRDAVAIDVAIIESGLPVGTLRLAVTEKGLCRIGLGDESSDAFEAWLAGKIGGPLRRYDSPFLQRAAGQLGAYLKGELTAFDLALDMRGTPFQKAVWQAVREVRFGGRVSYGQIAAQIGRPNAARAVGAANGANPLPLVVPCHRVVGSDGALCGYGGGLEVKAFLLEFESRQVA